MKKYLSIIILLLLPLVVSIRQAQAHPHVWVDAALTFQINDSGLASLQENWLFDDIFTNAILSDLELDAASLATTIGQEKIREGAFAYLANFNYFTLIETGGKRLKITAKDFKASLRDGRLVYDFTVPLNLPFDKVKDFRAAVFDKEYYSDILLLKDKLSFEIDGMAQVSHVVRPAKDHTYWQFIVPEAVHLSISGQPDSKPDLPAAELPVESPGPIERLMSLVRSLQKELTLRLNGFGMDIRDNPFGSALWMFLGLSFVYGVVHAVGPGHGKTVVCSYFLSNPGSFFTGALMGNTITFVHMGSAALAVGVAYLFFSSGMGGFQAASRALAPASYALLALMGVVLLIKALRDVFRGGLLTACSCVEPTADPDDAAQIRKVLTVSFVTGLIPCPGAAVILAFAIGQDIFWAGMGALVVMAIGMGVTTTLFAWVAVSARGLTLRMTGSNRKLFNWMYAGLSICGALVIAVFGTALFLSSPGIHQYLVW